MLGVEYERKNLSDGCLEFANVGRQVAFKLKIAVEQVQQQVVTCADKLFPRREAHERLKNKTQRDHETGETHL